MKLAPLLIVLYLASVAVTFGALNANDQWGCHHKWQNICDTRMVRKDVGADLFISVMPVIGFLATIQVTGFYMDGISFSAFPDHK